MVRRGRKLRFFLDQNVPDSIAHFLEKRGHFVAKLRDYIPVDSTDPVVAMAALQAGCVLVSIDKDFNSQRFRQPRFSALSRLALSGDGPTLLPAVVEHIDVIEFQLGRVSDGGRTVAHTKVGDIRFRHN